MEEHIKASSLDTLKLDDKQTIGYTFKALGAGFYGLRHAKDFRETLLKVIMQAGDADRCVCVYKPICVFILLPLSSLSHSSLLSLSSYFLSPSDFSPAMVLCVVP